MNFNISPIAFYPSRAAQQWRNAYNQCNIAVVTGDNLPPFIINNAPDTAPDTVEIYDPNTDTLIHTIHDVTDILAHTSTVNGVSVKSWIYQGTSAGIWGFTNPGYYYLKIGNYYSDIIKFGAVGGDYVKLEYQFFDDIITADGTLISKYIVYRQIFETVLWHPNYEVNEEGKENNGVFYALQQITKKTCGFSDTVNEAQLDTLNLARMADNVNIEARTNGFLRTFATNTFEIKSKWESDDVASIEVTFDLFNIMMKYQQSNVAPEPLPLPTPPVPPANYFIKGKTQSGVSLIQLKINGTNTTIPVTNGEFVFAYDSPLISLRTSTSSGTTAADTGLQNVDKITELDLSESDGFRTATAVILNQLTRCTKIDLTGCSFESVTTIDKMFDGNQAVTTISMPTATFAAASNGGCMYRDCLNLTTLNMQNAQLKVGSFEMFSGCTKLATADLRNCTFEDDTNARRMFSGVKHLNSNWRFDSATFADVVDCRHMFDAAKFEGLATISALFPVWAAEPTNAEAMFKGASTSQWIEINGIDFSNCTNFKEFMQNTPTELSPRGVDMSSGEDLSYSFDNHILASGDYAHWLTVQTFAAAIDTSYMFRNGLIYDPTFSLATFEHVTNAEGMFMGCKALIYDFPIATFASLTNAYYIFGECAFALQINLTSATFASVTTSAGMFWGCNALNTLNVPNTATMPVSFGFSQSSLLDVETLYYISRWIADKTNQQGKILTLNSSAVSRWQSDPTDANKFATYKSAIEAKNWTLQY